MRRDAGALPEVLAPWEIHVAASGVLTPWDGAPLDPERSQNNLWCRPTPDASWRLDVLVGEGDDTHWIYRRDPTVRRPWPDAVLTSSEGIPYLAPEIQLLFKSATIRPKDAVDAAEVIPHLGADRRSWLAAQLPGAHPWQATIADA